MEPYQVKLLTFNTVSRADTGQRHAAQCSGGGEDGDAASPACIIPPHNASARQRDRKRGGGGALLGHSAKLKSVSLCVCAHRSVVCANVTRSEECGG